jgi:hypothetical protein
MPEITFDEPQANEGFDGQGLYATSNNVPDFGLSDFWISSQSSGNEPAGTKDITKPDDKMLSAVAG